MKPLAPEERADRRDRIEFEYSDEQVEAAWSRFPDVQPAKSRSAWWLGGGAIAVAAAAALVLWTTQRDTMPGWDGERLASGTQRLQVRMNDGSEIELVPDSELLRLPADGGDTRLQLEGEASFDVAHDPLRAFVVMASGVEVRVIGTKFTVRQLDDEVQVEVQRGSVDVRSGERVERVTAGERYRVGLAVVEAPIEPEIEEPAASSAMRQRPPANRASAAELFARAQDRKRSGDYDGAATVLAQLVQRYPRNPRASLAAVDLGRIRMDRLRDRAGAVRAFRRALALNPRMALREDVLARLVRAQDTTARRRACLRDRDRYLREYPRGVHRRDVEAACGD